MLSLMMLQIKIAKEYLFGAALQGQSQFRVLAFGLTNAPATFHFAVDERFSAQLRRYNCNWMTYASSATVQLSMSSI